VRIPLTPVARSQRLSSFPDPSCNGYLAFTALLMAGLDGIQNKLVPPDPIDKDLYDLEPEEKAKVKSTPGSLEEILNSLEADHDFLLKGDVFTKDVIETWLDYNGPRKWTQSVCVLIPMSLPSTSTFNRS
jgi:glutamine synthetase